MNEADRRLVQNIADRLEEKLDSIDRKLEVGARRDEMLLGDLVQSRSAEVVVALHQLIDLVRPYSDQLIESILDEAVEEGLLEPEAGLPGEWEEPPEEAALRSSEVAETPEEPDESAYKQVKTELETFLRGREVDIENPTGHHRGELREYSTEKLAMALTDKLVGMKLE